MRKLAMLIVLAQMLFGATTSVAAADSSSRSVTTHGLTVHFGIVPAEKAPRVPEEGSAPGDTKAAQNLASYHLVVALFDARTGARIDNAMVIARGAFDSRAFFQLDAFKPDKTLPCGPK